MIDINVLAKPIFDLLASFGTGVLPVGGPGDALRTTSTAIDQVHELGRNSINQMNSVWDGKGADAATSKALRVQTSAATISDRGNEMSTVVGQAAAEVETGQKDLTAIAQSFVDTAVAAGPTLTTPVGLSMLVGSAIDHLGQALGVVGRVQNELSTHTASMQQLAPPPSTAPASVAAPVSAATSGLGSMASGVMGTAGSMLSTVMSSPSTSSGSRSSSSGSRTATSSSSKSGSGTTGSGKATGEGVMITLPDGSQVEAPNEKAATAVKAAIGAVGTPYVWGGNTPGAGIDCSGLTKYAYGEAGVELPRLAQEQHIGHTQVSPGDLMPGDLAVWDGHVAMVVGNGQLVEAGDPVSISAIRTENLDMEFYGFYRPTE
ncbi:C40 family peptidase [Nocardia cyriacigeorgica]|uniref:Hydrolase n=2 Tax=Nocardia cyriacigeorgica TaxID=135487 RepID=A0A5R8NZZ6_9NOCA|nr:C40 family peptidase [Nocardia cyriacigeorgica]TLF82281.1 hydrolase [Nocardia cyriacigeorgica]